MAAPTYQLTMRSGPTPGKTYQLDQEETIVGRDLANDIAISDPEVLQASCPLHAERGRIPN